MIISEAPHKAGSPEDVAYLMWYFLKNENEIDRDKEHFWVLGLNSQNKTNYIELVALGTLDSCPVEPREVFRLAIVRACKKIIVCHNHPSGMTDPSTEDILATKRLKKAGNIIGIKLIDHVIIGGEHFVDFRSII